MQFNIEHKRVTIVKKENYYYLFTNPYLYT